jgi:small subunit ribosomal protein S4
VNLYGSDKYDRILQRKPYGPGKGPRARSGKLSEYAQQLLEKQKICDMFGLTEKQCKRAFQEAHRQKGATGVRLLQILETRLDNTLFRSGFVLSRPQARQAVSHGHFLLNGRRTDRPFQRVRPGDHITIRQRSAHSPLFVDAIAAREKYLPPSWLRVSPSNQEIEILSLPLQEHFEQGIDIQKVVELYSR